MDRLSHFVLDRVQDAVKQGASAVWLTITRDVPGDAYQVSVEDDRDRFRASSAQGAAEGGERRRSESFTDGPQDGQETMRVHVRRSVHGGLCVETVLTPEAGGVHALHDLAAAISSVVCVSPGLEVRCLFICGGWERRLRVSDVASRLPPGERAGLAVARLVFHELEIAGSQLAARAAGD